MNSEKANRIAMRIAKTEPVYDAFPTAKSIADFLLSQVKIVEIEISLPNINNPVNDDQHVAAQKYPQPDKKKRNERFHKQIEKETSEIEQIKEQWKVLARKVKSLPDDNNGQSFYGDLAVKVLKNSSIRISFDSRNKNINESERSNDPYDKSNKNNPFLYEGIDNEDGYRNFMVKKFENNQMVFKECIAHPYDSKMPLDIYMTTAIRKDNAQTVDVYIKFSIHQDKAKVNLIFESQSFHA